MQSATARSAIAQRDESGDGRAGWRTSVMRMNWRGCVLLLVVSMALGVRGFAVEEPVAIIASQRTEVRTPSGVAVVPLDISLDWSKPQPGLHER